MIFFLLNHKIYYSKWYVYKIHCISFQWNDIHDPYFKFPGKLEVTISELFWHIYFELSILLQKISSIHNMLNYSIFINHSKSLKVPKISFRYLKRFLITKTSPSLVGEGMKYLISRYNIFVNKDITMYWSRLLLKK